MAKTATRKFTDDELKTIGTVARRVWNNIAGDIFEAMAYNEETSPDASELSRDNVIELVLDASRLEEELRHTKGVDKALVQRVADDIYGKRSEVEAFLKTDVFTYSRYGM